MTNPHGTPIWYELMTADPAASAAFYDHVIGWSTDVEAAGDLDYRMIDTGHEGLVGGMLTLTADMAAHGAKPTWLFYIGVDDVDATVAKVTAAGGAVYLPAHDMPGVGRFAMVADPQGIPFYVMRGASDESSTAYDRTGMGKCNWNELITPDQAAANAFYAEIFGWIYPDKMTMPGDMGDYWFVDVAGTQIGATMQDPGAGHSAAPAPGWRFYFRTPDIEATAAKVAEAGGSVMMGPQDVPGGDRIILASDPHGIVFGAVGPGNA